MLTCTTPITFVYKDLIISTIVDGDTAPMLNFIVYKDLIISTIVDLNNPPSALSFVYKDLIISTIVDRALLD